MMHDEDDDDDSDSYIVISSRFVIEILLYYAIL